MLLPVLWLFAQAAKEPSPLPPFDQFKVTETFQGKPAPPLLATGRDPTFRTMIREGASEGPNFAGHLTIAVWGCGAGCVSGALIDAIDGKVRSLPFSVLSFAQTLKFADGADSNSGDFEPLLFNLKSRLLLVRGCPEEKNCASYYYEWTGAQFRQIRTVTARITSN